jgi:hypothetical protein
MPMILTGLAISARQKGQQMGIEDRVQPSSLNVSP